jgi:hypothetical protein
MLFFMAAATHFPSLTSALDTGGGSLTGYWIVALMLIGLVEVNGLIGPGAASQKPLTTVKGTIHGGVLLTVALYLTASLML